MLELVIVPDNILHQKSQEVKTVNKNTQQFIDDMLKTMYHNKGVGLAAVQVGVLKKIIVIDMQELKEEDEEIRPEGFYPLHIINPEITEKSIEKTFAKEGCLSLPEQFIELDRSEKITVKYLDYNGNLQILEADGWLARAIQHEVDHLYGKLIIDHLSIIKKDVVIRKLTRVKKSQEQL